MVAGNGLTVVAFIYISLVYNENENLFLGLAICINFSVKCLYVSSHFLNQFVRRSLYIPDTNPLCRYHFPVLADLFTFF